MDVVTLPPEIDKSKIDSRYRLVIITAQRAKRLASSGLRPQIQTRSTKPTTMALEEALESRLDVVTGDEAKKAKRDARKAEARRMAEMERREEPSGELSEIEKDLQMYLHEKEHKDRQAIEDLFATGEANTEEAEGGPDSEQNTEEE